MKEPFCPRLLPHHNLQWEPLIPLIGQANRALAHYDGVLYGMPNPAVLLSLLGTHEAVLSSKISGARSQLDEVLKSEAGEEPSEEMQRRELREIENYRTALRIGEKELAARPFSLDLLLTLHATLLTGVRGRDKGRGRFRTVQNYLGGNGTSSERVIFIPPEPRRLPELLDNWATYYHTPRPDALVQLAVLHAQFELLHPFVDGNGRLGRMLIPLYLYEKKILSRPLFYFSAYIDRHREAYLHHLQPLSESHGPWNHWIIFFLEALIEQARENASKARSFTELYEQLKSRIIEITHSKYAVPLLDALFARPILRSSELESQRGLPSKPMIMSMLGKLKQDGILKVVREGSGRRAQVLALTDLINLCEGKKVL